jgi:UDP-N-acetylglucosamine--N-acetylmuramyl-(pentapeptide) pyrophosphoryl-undecaprenol N-acetylglucosamine transferase
MEQQTKITTCFVAGRSGGHIIPALTLARTLIEKNQQHRILFFSTATPLDHKIIATSNDVHTHVPLDIENIPYRKPWMWFRYAYRLTYAYLKSLQQLRLHRPDRVVSMGGYVSLPVCLAAWWLCIPIELYELNVEPGMASSWLARIADRIFICFKESAQYFGTYQHKCHYTEYPIRFSLMQRTGGEHEARIILDIPHDAYVILVLGGSQGSQYLNTYVQHWLTTTTSTQPRYVLHQIGEHTSLASWTAWYAQAQINARVFAYNHDMALLYTAADFIICRSGAGTLFEIVAFNKRCLTIPLETSTNNHQVANAYAMAKQYPEFVTVVRQEKD